MPHSRSSTSRRRFVKAAGGAALALASGVPALASATGRARRGADEQRPVRLAGRVRF